MLSTFVPVHGRASSLSDSLSDSKRGVVVWSAVYSSLFTLFFPPQPPFFPTQEVLDARFTSLDDFRRENESKRKAAHGSQGGHSHGAPQTQSVAAS